MYQDPLHECTKSIQKLNTSKNYNRQGVRYFSEVGWLEYNYGKVHDHGEILHEI